MSINELYELEKLEREYEVLYNILQKNQQAQHDVFTNYLSNKLNISFGDTISFERLGKRIKGIFIGFGLSINPRLTNSIEVIVKAFNEKEKNYSTNPDTIKLEEKSTLLNKVFIVSYSGELPSLKGFNKHTIAISKTEAIKTVFDQHIGPQNDGESKDPLDCNKIFYKGGYFKAEKL